MLRAEIERRTKGLPASPDPRLCLVDDLLEALEARYTTEGRRSLARLKFSKEHLLRLFKGVQAMRVTGADVLRYAQQRLGEEAAPATVNRELAALRAAYRLGLDNEVIQAMPRIRLLPEDNVRKGFAEASQVEAICKRLSEDVADVVRFGFLTSWRRTEVLELRWAQVDWSGGFVRLEPGTTKNREGAPSQSRRRSGPCWSGARSGPASASGPKRGSSLWCFTGAATPSGHSAAPGPRPATRPVGPAFSSMTCGAARCGAWSVRASPAQWP
jgi:hypothetical protein